ncbi:MAG: biopolymer transporter ExbD [Betaproteobacteria bacterium]|nr:biopolymer transporter ExbD [Betaproteobacteria bacterium]
MGMNVGSGGGSEDPDVMMDINTTPLIDVMLVLLIMLIITIPMQLHSVNLDMPTGKPPAKVVEPEVVKIEVLDNGAVLWNGEALADRSALEARLELAKAQPEQPELHIKAAAKAKYEVLAGVLASAQRVGLTKLGILGSEQFAN